MTIPPLLELVRRTSDRIESEYGLDAGLDSVVEAIEDAGQPSDALRVAKALLRDRARAARAVVDEVEGLRTKVRRLAEIARFSEEGWPERRATLEAALEADPLNGLADWLSEWFAAASRGHTGAAERLAEVGHMPSGAALLLERCRTAARGLEHHDWHVARTMLSAGASGVRVGDRVVPEDAETRTLLLLALARLALYGGLPDEAEPLLDRAAAAGETPGVSALRSWMWRLRGDEERARKHLNEANRYGPADLDVVVETIEWATGEDRLEIGLGAARIAVNALMLLQTVDDEVARLGREPPAEVWIAVGERALRESDLELFDRALERAAFAAPYDDWVLRAVIAELRLAGVERRGASGKELIEAIVWAGDARLDAGQLDIASKHYERAHSLDPADPDPALKLADCVIALRSADPLDTSRDTLESSLELILGAQRQGAITAENAWTYLSEAVARERLAEQPGAAQSDHLWRAFVAVCRALAYAPYSGTRWVELSTVADALNLPLVALKAATQAVKLDPFDDRCQLQHILALTNLGRVKEALDALEGHTDAWDVAARGYLLARLGEPDEAVSVLRSTQVDPTWSWASLTLMWSLAITGREDEAAAEASSLVRTWETRLDEENGLWPSMWAALMLGDFSRAEQLGGQLLADKTSEDDELLPIGLARILGGDQKAGVETVRRSVDGMKTTRELDEWRAILEPFLRVLAKRYEVTLPSLDPISDAVARRAEAVTASPDALAQLREAVADHGDEELAKAALGFGAAFIRLAADDPEGALAALESAGLSGPDVETLLAALREQVSVLADPSGDPTAEALAREAADAASRGADEEAERALKGLLDIAPAGAGQLLLAVTDAQPSARIALGHALLDVAVAPEYSTRALELRSALAGEVAPPPLGVQLALPGSWFEGHDDPVNDHPLFLRFFPEVRIRTPAYVPPIHVYTDDSLEPDGYRVLADGEVRDEGHADPAYVLVEDDALRVAGARAVDAAAPSGTPGISRLPAEVAEPDGGLLHLLAMSALELVARKAGEVAVQYGDAGSPTPPTSSKVAQ